MPFLALLREERTGIQMLNNLFLAQAQPGGLSGMLIPMLIVIGIFYFMMIRPQQRKERERKKMIEELRAGQRVLFAGGLIGTIKEAKEFVFLIEIADGVVIEVARGAISRALADGEVAVADEQG